MKLLPNEPEKLSPHDLTDPSAKITTVKLSPDEIEITSLMLRLNAYRYTQL